MPAEQRPALVRTQLCILLAASGPTSGAPTQHALNPWHTGGTEGQSSACRPPHFTAAPFTRGGQGAHGT